MSDMGFEVDDPERGRVRQVGPIARLTETPAVPVTPAPRVGEHTDEVLSESRDRPGVTPLEVSPGDRLLIGKYAGTEVNLDGEEHIIIREDDVLGVLS